MQGVEEICLIVNSTIFTKLKSSASKKKIQICSGWLQEDDFDTMPVLVIKDVELPIEKLIGPSKVYLQANHCWLSVFPL